MGFEPTAMGIESPMPPTNLAATGVGEPAARGLLPSTATDAWFTAATEWIDSSGLTSVDAGLEFSALKRACYLFVHFIERRLGPAACAARVAAIFGSCSVSGSARSFLAARKQSSYEPAGAAPCRDSDSLRAYCRDPAGHAGDFRLRRRHFARPFLGRPALRRDAIHHAFGRELEGV